MILQAKKGQKTETPQFCPPVSWRPPHSPGAAATTSGHQTPHFLPLADTFYISALLTSWCQQNKVKVTSAQGTPPFFAVLHPRPVLCNKYVENERTYIKDTGAGQKNREEKREKNRITLKRCLNKSIVMRRHELRHVTNSIHYAWGPIEKKWVHK